MRLVNDRPDGEIYTYSFNPGSHRALPKDPNDLISGTFLDR
jgi:hypothetical protein